MGWIGDAWDWFTGHDREAEADVIANYDKLDEVITNLNNIKTKEVETARELAKEALNNLNNVNGMQYVGNIDPDLLNKVFDSIGQSISSIAIQMQQNAQDIKKYDEASFLEKVGSTVLMGVSKVGEGILSVIEDIGDAAVSIVGWSAGTVVGLVDDNAGQAIKDGTAEFVKKDFSHDAFSFYYDSDFAKKSAITEDSGAASLCKIGGEIGGYVIGAGALSAAGEALSAAGKTGKIATTATKVFTSPIGSNTLIATTAGIGGGTESGLKAGMDLDSALGEGLKQGAIQGAAAYTISKVGEKISKSIATKKLANTKSADILDANGNVIGKTTYKVTDTAIGKVGDKADDLFLSTTKSKLALDSTSNKAFLIEKTADKTDDVVLRLSNQADDTLLAAAGETSDDALTKLLTKEERLALPKNDVESIATNKTASQKLASEYKTKLGEMLDNQIGIEDFFEANGEKIVRSQTRIQSGELFQDANGEMHSIIDRVGKSTGIKQKYLNEVDRYLNEVSDHPAESINMEAVGTNVKKIFAKSGLNSEMQEEMWNVYKYRVSTNSPIDSTEMFSSLQKHMTEEEVGRITKIINNNDSYAKRMVENATQAQKDATYIYTKNGYEEFNSILTKDVKGYQAKHYTSKGMSQEDMLKDVYKTGLGNSTNAQEGCEALQELVRNNKIQENIVVHRSVKSFGNLKKVKELKAGATFHNEGFTSATASAEDFSNIATKMLDNNIRLDIIVPGGSEAAYIEPLSGVPRYFQNEVLINPNSTLTIIEDAYQEKVGKRLITVVKCILT